MVLWLDLLHAHAFVKSGAKISKWKMSMEKSIFLLPYHSRLTFNVTQNELDDKDKHGVK